LNAYDVFALLKASFDRETLPQSLNVKGSGVAVQDCVWWAVSHTFPEKWLGWPLLILLLWL